MATQRKRVLILGGNFAGLGAAQKIRDYAGKDVDITLVDRHLTVILNGKTPHVVLVELFTEHGAGTLIVR